MTLLLTKSAAEVYAVVKANGDPRGPNNGEALVYHEEMERSVEGATAGRVDQVLWSGLSAISGTRAGQPALVYGPDAGTHTDPVAGGTVANTGSYIWSVSPAGWRRVGGLPASLVHASNSGAGTADDVVATTQAQFSTEAYGTLITVNFVAANPTSGMTLSLNGEPARDLVTNTGGVIPAEYVTGGMSALVQIDQNGDYRLFSYGDATAVAAAAEAAKAAAEAAKVEAEAAAALADQKFFTVRVADTGGGDPATGYENGDTIDGVALATGDRLLRATAGGDPADGVYLVPASGAASRVTVLDVFDDLPGCFFSVMEGTAKADTLWRCTSNTGGTLGVTNIVIAEFTPANASPITVTDRAALKALPAPSPGDTAFGTQDGWAGSFVFRAGDYSAEVAADTQEGIYIKATDTAATSGAWVRHFDGPLNPRWFSIESDTGGDVSAVWNAMIAVAKATSYRDIYLHRGTYTFTSKPTTFDFAIEIRGRGKSGTGFSRNYAEASEFAGFFAFVNGTSGSILKDFSIAASSGSSGGCGISIVPSGSGACDYIKLDGLNVTSEAPNKWGSLSLHVDGIARTSSGLGVRDMMIRDCSFFGAPYGAVQLKGCVALTWNGGSTFVAGGSSGAIVITGDATVKCNQMKIAIGQCTGLSLSQCVDTVFVGNVVGNITNDNTCVDFNGFGNNSGTVDSAWITSKFTSPTTTYT